jgi:hypothetical protein
LRIPGVCHGFVFAAFAVVFAVVFNGCGKAPLGGQQGAAHAFRHGNATLLDSLHAPMAVRQERLGHVDARSAMENTHVVTADKVRVAGELGALLDKGIFAQDLPKFPPNAEMASKFDSEAV